MLQRLAAVHVAAAPAAAAAAPASAAAPGPLPGPLAPVLPPGQAGPQLTVPQAAAQQLPPLDPAQAGLLSIMKQAADVQLLQQQAAAQQEPDFRGLRLQLVPAEAWALAPRHDCSLGQLQSLRVLAGLQLQQLHARPLPTRPVPWLQQAGEEQALLACQARCVLAELASGEEDSLVAAGEQLVGAMEAANGTLRLRADVMRNVAGLRPGCPEEQQLAASFAQLLQGAEAACQQLSDAIDDCCHWEGGDWSGAAPAAPADAAEPPAHAAPARPADAAVFSGFDSSCGAAATGEVAAFVNPLVGGAPATWSEAAAVEAAAARTLAAAEPKRYLVLGVDVNGAGGVHGNGAAVVVQQLKPQAAGAGGQGAVFQTTCLDARGRKAPAPPALQLQAPEKEQSIALKLVLPPASGGMSIAQIAMHWREAWMTCDVVLRPCGPLGGCAWAFNPGQGAGLAVELEAAEYDLPIDELVAKASEPGRQQLLALMTPFAPLGDLRAW